jgi:signal transduction histidine kinase
MKFSLTVKFLLLTGLLLTACLGISFYTIARHQEGLILEQAENEAKAIFRQIILTRKWVADHGGIFVERKPWLKSNTYLSQIGEEPEIMDVKGRILIKENPAFVTRELSRYAREKELYWFKITSLKLINPLNAPDEWERKALREFEVSSKKELTAFQTIEGQRYLRFISPLYIEESCLRCHAKQGYKIGDVRGAISITIPVEKIFTEITENRKRMLIAAVLTISSLLIALYILINRITLSPIRRLKNAMKSFSEGETPSAGFIKTGDEIGELAKAFSQMAEKLTDYHNCLHDRIRSAVKELEETNRKLIETNKLLNEANKRKSDFIARASHELRTPLTSIKGGLDYLTQKFTRGGESNSPSYLKRGEGGVNKEDLEFIEIIKKNTERLIRLVNDMLDIEKIESGLQELHLRESDLSAVIKESVESFKPQAEEKGVRFYLDIAHPLPCIVDEDRIKQVFTNLISNALRWSPPGSTVEISAERRNGEIISEIKDRGPGIPPDEQSKVFERFYKKSRDGTGLGLTIAKGIIEAHGGEIGVISDGKNGATFYVRLKAENRAVAQQSSRAVALRS